MLIGVYLFKGHDPITGALAKRGDAKLNDDIFVCSAAYFLVQFWRCAERTCSFIVQTGEFGIDREEAGFLNHFVEFIQYATKIYRQTKKKQINWMRLGSRKNIRFIPVMGSSWTSAKHTFIGHVHFLLIFLLIYFKTKI